ncbi:MAG: hypothetical protein ACYC1D_08865 [Acidimicrobiales bacterium]
MISEADVSRITEACQALPEPVGDYPRDEYLTNLVATGVDFQTRATAGERALVPLAGRPGRQHRPRAASVELRHVPKSRRRSASS